jgi:hypothetical protein
LAVLGRVSSAAACACASPEREACEDERVGRDLVVVRVPLSSAAACACASLRGNVHGCGEWPIAEVVARITGINRKRDLNFMDSYLFIVGSDQDMVPGCDPNGE